MAKSERPKPRVRELTAEFWQGCKLGELRIQRCRECGRYRFPPTAMCGYCNSIESE